jgi:Fur family peroxide stress response transcriptional regulator
MNQAVISRDTKYSREIVAIINRLHHATNADILHEIQKVYPDVSATTVHRSTARLADRGLLNTAPPDNQGSMRYDANLNNHDHFVCIHCGGVRDIDVAEALIPAISEALGGCKITGRLLIQGSCEKCITKNRRSK